MNQTGKLQWYRCCFEFAVDESRKMDYPELEKNLVDPLGGVINSTVVENVGIEKIDRQ